MLFECPNLFRYVKQGISATTGQQEEFADDWLEAGLYS